MPPPNNSSRHRLYFAAGATGLAIVSIVWFTWWNRPPQMGADEGVFATVDALFTAVTGRDEKLLVDCERRLHTLKDVDKLPSDASAHLDNIIGKARAGRWESAAQALYDFMRAQRRDGTHEHAKSTKRRSNSSQR